MLYDLDQHLPILPNVKYNGVNQIWSRKHIGAACGPADMVAYLDFIHLLGLPARLAVDVALILSSSQ